MDIIVVGTEAPIQHTLKNDGATFDATGFTAAIDMKDEDGDAVAGLTISWADPLVSKIQIDDPSALTPGLYTFRWKVTDGNADDQFYPGNQTAPLKLRVVPVH